LPSSSSAEWADDDATIRVAIADDHAILRAGLGGLISSLGGLALMHSAPNGRALLDWLEQTPVAPHVCILDINMPVMNGYETAAAIRKNFPAVRTLALSMYDKEESIIRMLRAGAAGYMLKDSEPGELRNALESVHRHGVYHSELTSGNRIRTLLEKNGPEVTEAERKFLELCCTELTYREIAEKLVRSPKTVDGYRESLFAKLGVASRTGLVIWAIRTGLVAV